MPLIHLYNPIDNNIETEKGRYKQTGSVYILK